MDPFRCDRCRHLKWRCEACRTIAHRAAVKKFRDKHRSGRPTGAPKRSSVRDDDLVAKYLSGMSTFAIAKTVNLTPAGVAYRLHRLGIQLRPKWDHPEFRYAVHPNHGNRNGNWIELPMEEIIQMYQAGMCAEEIARDLGTVIGGTIVYRLRRAGITVDSSGWGRAHTAKDGHRVSSSLELAVDNWLFDHNVRHTVHPRLPWGTLHRADFLVGQTTFVEVWGVINNPAYNARRQQKVALYQLHGNALVEVFLHDVCNGLGVLNPLLGTDLH